MLCIKISQLGSREQGLPVNTFHLQMHLINSVQVAL